MKIRKIKIGELAKNKLFDIDEEDSDEEEQEKTENEANSLNVDINSNEKQETDEESEEESEEETSTEVIEGTSRRNYKNMKELEIDEILKINSSLVSNKIGRSAIVLFTLKDYGNEVYKSSRMLNKKLLELNEKNRNIKFKIINRIKGNNGRLYENIEILN